MLIQQIDEILIFGNDRSIGFPRFSEYGRISRIAQVQILGRETVIPKRSRYPGGQRRRQLGVNPERHAAARKTG